MMRLVGVWSFKQKVSERNIPTWIIPGLASG